MQYSSAQTEILHVLSTDRFSSICTEGIVHFSSCGNRIPDDVLSYQASSHRSAVPG